MKSLSLFLISNCLFSFLFSPLYAQSSVKAIATEVNHYIDAHEKSTLQLLETVVNINSQTENIKGVRAVGNIFENELKNLGFHTYWECMPHSMKRAGNLFAVRKGTMGKRLLLIGHLDTVFAADKSHSFKRIGKHTASGIGAADMKGGDVVILNALKALAHIKQLENVTIAVALIGDEESSGQPSSISRRELRRLASESDIALDFESAPLSLGRRGISRWKLVTTGVQQHSSLIFQKEIGDGAIYEIARILSDFDKKLSQVDNLTINPSLVLGGSTLHLNGNYSEGKAAGKINVVAKNGYAIGDMRYLTLQQRDETKKIMQRIVAMHFPKTSAQLEFIDTIPPMPPLAANQQLLTQLNAINGYVDGEVLVPLAPRFRGAGDISYIADLVKAGLIGMGVAGADEHTLHETIDLRSLPKASKRAALLIYALTHS